MINTNYSPINLGDTKDLSNEEWLNWRMHGPFYKDPTNPKYVFVAVGGSDVAVIEGDSSFKSKMELFHVKSGVKKPKYKREMDAEILENGHELEEYVAKRFKKFMFEACGVEPSSIKIINDTSLFQHPHYSFSLCNLDRRIWINGIEGILEIKTTANLDDIALWKKGIVPKKYEWQCRYYMATMNVDYTYIACMWGFTTKEMAVIKIERDLEIEEKMLMDVKEFVECCEMGIEPKLQQSHTVELSKYYVRLYGEIDEKATPIEFPDTEEIRELIDEAFLINEEKALLAAKEKELSEREGLVVSKILKYTDGKSLYGTLRLDDETVAGLSVKVPMHKAVFDEESFKEEFPEAYNEFLKPSVPKFDATACKKKYPSEYGKHLLSPKVNIEKKPTLNKVEIRNIPVKEAI